MATFIAVPCPSECHAIATVAAAVSVEFGDYKDWASARHAAIVERFGFVAGMPNADDCPRAFSGWLALVRTAAIQRAE